MNVIPSDVLIYILSRCYIREINLVCKKWKKIAYNESSRNRILNIKLYGKKRVQTTYNFFNEFLYTLDNFKGKFGDITLKHIFQKMYIDLLCDNLKNFRPKTLIITTNIDVHKKTFISNFKVFQNIKLINSIITISSDITLPKNLYLYDNSFLYKKGNVRYKGIEKIYIQVIESELYFATNYLRYRNNVFPDLKCFNISSSYRKFSITDYNVFYSCVMDTDISLEINEESMSDELKQYLKERDILNSKEITL